MSFIRQALAKVTACGIVLTLCLIATGCPAAEENASVAALQAGLASLVNNRTLAEQFVRDVKTSVSPNDPTYQQAMESYEQARDSYNRYLDSAEYGEAKNQSARNELQMEMNAQDSTAGFLQDATRALKPSMNTRAIDFRRAVQIPDNLTANLHKLPKKERGAVIHNFDDQVRWRSWGEM
jgi:hypothetical protein